MADNVTANPGAAGAVFATDDIGGVQHPYAKIEWGPADTANSVDVASGKPLPVQLRDSTGALVTKAEDAAHSSGDFGIMALTVRQNTAAALAGTDADYQPLITDTNGRLHVIEPSAAGALTSLQLIDDAVFAEDVAANAADKGVGVLAVRRDANTSLVDTTGDYANLQVTALGNLKVAIIEDSVGSAIDSDDGTVAGGQGTVALTIGLTQVWDGSNWKRVSAATPMYVGGDVAHDAADGGSPVKVGAKAVNAEPAAVANADRANLITDLVGKLITLPYANPENFVSGCISSAMTGTTSTSLVGAPGAGLRNYITTIIASCGHATQGTDILIQDGSGGTTLMVIPAAALFGGAAITLPTPLRQPTANTALYAQNVTTGSSTKVTALGYKGA